MGAPKGSKRTPQSAPRAPTVFASWSFVKSRRIKHFLRLNYPLQVVWAGQKVRGFYPDLQGCEVESRDVREIYALAEVARRQWLTESVLIDAPIPLPNTYLDERHARPAHRGEEKTGSGAAPALR